MIMCRCHRSACAMCTVNWRTITPLMGLVLHRAARLADAPVAGETLRGDRASYRSLIRRARRGRAVALRVVRLSGRAVSERASATSQTAPLAGIPRGAPPPARVPIDRSAASTARSRAEPDRVPARRACANPLIAFVTRRRCGPVGHAAVMTETSAVYKINPLNSYASPSMRSRPTCLGARVRPDLLAPCVG